MRIRLNGIAFGGDAVGRSDEGLAVFVPYGAPGDLADVEIVERRKSFARGRLVQLIEAAPDRVVAPCPHYGDCGGCHLQHLYYDAQLREKTRMVVDSVERIGRFPPSLVRPAIGARDPWHYRNKAGFVFGLDRASPGGPRLGFHVAGSHRIADIIECRIQDPLANQVLAAARRLLAGGRMPEAGELDVRINTARTEMVVTLAAHGESAFAARAAAESLRREVPAITGILLRHESPGRSRGREQAALEVLAGSPYLHETMAGYRWRVHAGSFFQVNPAQAERLLQTVLDHAAVENGTRVVDAFSGAGFFALPLAARGADVVGIEGSALAVADAEWNLKAPSTERTVRGRFIHDTVERGLARLRRESFAPDVVVLDPPRTGAREALPGIAALRPRRVVYVSCDPATLARDLRTLSGLGFETREVQPVDMFPQTYHVECVAFAERRERRRLRAVLS